MGFLAEVFATGLADKLYRNGFETIGKHQWDELVMTTPWVYVCGQVEQWGDKYSAQVSSCSIPGVYNKVGGKWVTIWHSKEFATYGEALGILTKSVRISQDKFPHLLFLRAIYNKQDKEPKYQEFLNNEWVNHPYNHPHANDWEPLRSVVKRCSMCNFFDDGLDDCFSNNDDEKLFSYDDNVSQCRKNKEFKCLQDR